MTLACAVDSPQNRTLAPTASTPVGPTLTTAYSVNFYAANGVTLLHTWRPGDGILQSLEYTLQDSAIGVLIIDSLPFAADSEIWRDCQVEVFRKPKGGAQSLEGATRWLLATAKKMQSDGAGGYRWSLEFRHANWLLERRHTLAWDTTSFQSLAQPNARPKHPAVRKTGKAGDVAKSFVYESLVIGVQYELPGIAPNYTANVPASSLPGYTVAGFSGDGSNVDIFSPHQTLYRTCRDIIDISRQNNVWLSFDTIWTGSGFMFKTYGNQRGADLRGEVVFSQKTRSVEKVAITSDWSKARSRVDVLGGGDDSAHFAILDTVNAVLRTEVPFGLATHHVPAYQIGDPDAQLMVDLARSELAKMRPSQTFSASLTDVGDFRYGVDYGFGDFIGLQSLDYALSGRANYIRVKVADGKESIETQIAGASNDFYWGSEISAPDDIVYLIGQKLNAVDLRSRRYEVQPIR